MVLPRLTVLDGRYAIGRVLEASQPLVFTYQAWNLHTEEQVILEEFFPTSLARRAEGCLEVEVVDPAHEALFRYGRDQFLKETAVLAAIEHPNLVRVQEGFESHSTAYRVLEHHKGALLASVLEKQGGKLPPKTAFTIVIPLLDALQVAHQQGLIHGAFSPKAVFLVKGRGPLLRGFRTTLVMLAQRTGDRQLLIEEGVSAPEQYEAGGRQGPWTDVYGSAATLFRMLTGHVLPAAPRRLEQDEVPALLHQTDGLPDALCHLLEQALSLDSARRPRSAQAFRQQLLDALKKKADPVAPASSVAQTPKPEPEMPPSEPPQTAMEEKPAGAVEAEAPVAIDEAPGEGREAAQVEQPVATEPEIPVPFEEERVAPQEPEVVSLVEEREDQATQEVAALAARAQATKDTQPQRKSGPRFQRSDPQAKRSRRGVPVLAALVVVVLVALSGAYVLMQNEGSEVAQFAHFKAQGDSLFAIANYIEAKTQYENALAALPNNEYVTNRLDETQQRLVEVRGTRYGHYLAQGDALYAQGDSLLNVGNTLEALSSFAEANKAFYEALRYQPGDSIVLDKGRRTAEGMQAALRKNREQTGQPASAQANQDPGSLRQQLYNSYRQQGDEWFARGAYTAARQKFSNALQELPRNDYATAKIEEIDRILEAAGREAAFQQLLEQGASLNDQGRYTEARIVFRQVQGLKPGHLQAYQGLTHADSMLALAQRAREYRRFRDEGDALMRQNKPNEALASYQQTLFFKPDDAYAKQRIREIQQPLDENQPPAQPPPQEPQEQPEPAPNVPKGDIHNVVDQAPELIGGLKVLHNMVNYPESARRQEIQGRVYVQFILSEKGQVEDAEVIRGIGGGCDEEALRVVREARFIPGKIAGKPVRVRHTLFITFKLN